MDHILTHDADALARLAEQYKNKERIAALISAFTPQIQELEDAYWQLFTEQSIDTAVGEQLDILGRIVGERRGGATDTDYRLRIRARIRANLSNGTAEDIYKVFRALLGPAGMTAVFQWLDSFPAMFVLRIMSPTIPASQVSIFVNFLRDSKAGGVGAHFGWQTVPDALAFTFCIGAFLTAPAMIGDTTITVKPITLAQFPATGVLLFDEGEATEETVNYAARTTTSFSGFTLAFAHDANACAKLVPSPGLGFGDDANPATGGAFVGVADVDV